VTAKIDQDFPVGAVMEHPGYKGMKIFVLGRPKRVRYVYAMVIQEPEQMSLASYFRFSKITTFQNSKYGNQWQIVHP